MPAASITITDTTKGPFNLYKVLAGLQTLGLTVGQTYPSIERSCQKRTLQADYGNGGTKIVYGADGSVASANGIGIVAGDRVEDSSPMPDISLTGMWFTATANGGILNVSVE